VDIVEVGQREEDLVEFRGEISSGEHLLLGPLVFCYPHTLMHP
jgi:hypothetical protein